MGATLRTFAVRRAGASDVRQSLVSWLRAKGFELADGPLLFPLDAETERRIVLSENQNWTIVAYSHEREEGDRLVFELRKLRKPLLEIWVYLTFRKSSNQYLRDFREGQGADQRP